MSENRKYQIENVAVKGALLSAVLSVFVIGLLIWGKLQLKEVPRTAEAQPESTQPVKAKPVDRVSIPDPSTAQTAPPLREPEKSEPEPADDREANLTGQAVWVLESMTLDNPPSAVLNGQTLTIGQQIDGYVLQEVTSQGVILEKDGIEIRVRK